VSGRYSGDGGLDARQGLPLSAVKRTFKALSMKEHYPPF
jgi:hypothetical protein